MWRQRMSGLALGSASISLTLGTLSGVTVLTQDLPTQVWQDKAANSFLRTETSTTIPFSSTSRAMSDATPINWANFSAVKLGIF